MDKRMYIEVNTAWKRISPVVGYEWLLFSHTGLVMARSDFYKRHCDASRVGKQVATRLHITFRGDL